MIEYVAYFFATLWSVGCVGFPPWAAYTLWDEGEVGVSVVFGFLGWPLGVAVAAVPWVLMADVNEPKFHLDKGQWVCTESSRRPTTTYVKTGSTMTPITTYRNVCHEYTKKAYVE